MEVKMYELNYFKKLFADNSLFGMRVATSGMIESGDSVVTPENHHSLKYHKYYDKFYSWKELWDIIKNLCQEEINISSEEPTWQINIVFRVDLPCQNGMFIQEETFIILYIKEWLPTTLDGLREKYFKQFIDILFLKSNSGV